MITYRQATFDDVENIHKLLNDYAHEGLMLPRARNAIYENLRDYIGAIISWRLKTTALSAAGRCILCGTALRKYVRWRLTRSARVRALAATLCTFWKKKAWNAA